MRNFLIAFTIVFFVSASIFGGLYYFAGSEQEEVVQENEALFNSYNGIVTTYNQYITDYEKVADFLVSNNINSMLEYYGAVPFGYLTDAQALSGDTAEPISLEATEVPDGTEAIRMVFHMSDLGSFISFLAENRYPVVSFNAEGDTLTLTIACEVIR